MATIRRGHFQSRFINQDTDFKQFSSRVVFVIMLASVCRRRNMTFF